MKKYLCIVGCLFILQVQAQNNNNQSQIIAAKARAIVQFLAQKHYAPRTWNDSSSAALFNNIIHEVDEYKLLFTKEDIAALEAYKNKLDDELTGKEWGFLDKLAIVVDARLKQTDSLVNKIAATPFDYTKPDIIEWPFTTYAAQGAAYTERWRQYLKWKTIDAISESYYDDDTISLLEQVKLPAGFAKKEAEMRIEERDNALDYLHDYKDSGVSLTQSLGEQYLHQVAVFYDPHTEYMNGEEKETFTNEVTAMEYSVGIEVSQNKNDEWEISYLIPGGPAWRNGELYKGDLIISAKVNDGTEVKLSDLSERQVHGILEGNGTEKVTLKVKNKAGVSKTFSLEKEKISSDEDLVKSFVLQGKKKVGYIKLPGFYTRQEDDKSGKSCSDDVAREAVKLNKENIDGLILDLRYNGGGSLGEALELAGIFIDEGALCIIKDKEKQHSLKDPNRGMIYTGPMIVMVNTMSASASELTAAALQDYNRALIVGSPTYGKGSAQLVAPLEIPSIASKTKSEDYIKYTMEKFYRIKGNTVQWTGVIPDVPLPDIFQLDRFREKANTSALIPDSCKKAYFNPMPAIPVQSIQEQSSKRVAGNDFFKSIKSLNEYMKARYNVQKVNLQFPAYAIRYQEKEKKLEAIFDENGKDSATGYTVTNHGFDKDRINSLSKENKELNDAWLKRIQRDMYLSETYNIMLDLINAVH